MFNNEQYVIVEDEKYHVHDGRLSIDNDDIVNIDDIQGLTEIEGLMGFLAVLSQPGHMPLNKVYDTFPRYFFDFTNCSKSHICPLNFLFRIVNFLVMSGHPGIKCGGNSTSASIP